MTACARLTAACDFAARAHAGQYRKGPAPVPYVNHVIAVAAMVAGVVGDADTDAVIAAMLHDTIEDTETTLGDIAEAFGARVAAIVDELTDAPAWAALPTAARKARQAEKFRTASQAARIVKLADQVHNLSDRHLFFCGWTNAQNRAYLEGAVAVAGACAGAAPTLETAFADAADRFRHRLDQEKTA